MKKLLLASLLAFVPTAYAAISLDPDNGDIVDTTPIPGGGSVVSVKGNIFDVYTIEKELYAEMETMYECSNAMASASLAAKPVAFEEGLALGVGLGGSGSCGAGAVALDYMVNETLSYNLHFSKATKSTKGTDAQVGAGLHFRF